MQGFKTLVSELDQYLHVVWERSIDNSDQSDHVFDKHNIPEDLKQIAMTCRWFVVRIHSFQAF